jgi:uncharacterized protein YacL
MTYYDPNNFEKDTPEDDQNIPSTPERHGCVTTWLIFILIVNSIIALFYSFTANKISQNLNTSVLAIMGLVILCAINVVCSAMLLTWKKIGFYGFVITTILAFILNLNIGISLTRSIIGLLGFTLLYAILQIKKDGVSAWNYLN